MDVIDHLMKEHREAEDMMRRLSETQPGEVRERLIGELDDALSTHMRVEEEFVYPIVADKVGKETEDEAEIEHGLARDGLSKLHELSAEPGFGAAVDMLRAGVKHHVTEEDEIFPKLRERAANQLADLDPEQLEHQVERADQTRDDFYQRAQAADIPGRSKMSKDELADAVEQQSS